MPRLRHSASLRAKCVSSRTSMLAKAFVLIQASTMWSFPTPMDPMKKKVKCCFTASRKTLKDSK